MKRSQMARLFLFLSLAASISAAADLRERLGPSSRRTGLVISEIMHHPSPRLDGKDLEFFELYNAQSAFEDLSGYRVSGTVDFTFPSGTLLAAGSFLVVARTPADVRNAYGLSNVVGGYEGSLRRDSGVVRLRHRTGAVFLEASYGTEPPWPAAGGAGHSLVLARPSLGENDPGAWAASERMGGSPGTGEQPETDPLRNVIINEILAQPTAGGAGFVELYNHSSEPVDLEGASLSADPTVAGLVFPAGTRIPAGGFSSFSVQLLGLVPPIPGGALYLRNAQRTRIVDAIRFGPQAEGISWGRCPDGNPGWRELLEPTPAARNSPLLVRDVVINEIMYHPISDSSEDEYVELYNRGSSEVSLAGWKFTDGIDFTFPPEATIAPEDYVVVARNAARLLTNYPNLNSSNTFGNYTGTLSDRGERLALSRPSTAPGAETSYMVVDEVTYKTGGRWGRWSDGGGSSLELTDPRSDHRLASNWADSDETGKAPWTEVEASGVLDNGVGVPDQLQILLQGAGECLVDDVEVFSPAGANLVPNSSFEAGASGWVAEGTQEESGLETEDGYRSVHSFQVRASGRGDDTVNRIRIGLSSPLSPGQTATIRAQARWLRGFPSLLLRLRGNHLEAIGHLSIPPNLGTPGARNSRAVANAGPAIHEVRHEPVLPQANEPVLVSARLQDPDGLSSVVLRYRVDPAPDFTSVEMTDDGANGDALAGDGVYSARIPGKPAGALVAFHILAADGVAAPANAAFPSDAPSRECLVRFGEAQPSGSFGTYRLWMTRATFDRWTRRHKLHNAPLDVTFVYNDERVIYNAQALFAGSPYISPSYSTPNGNLCGYTVILPDDDRFLGDTDVVLDWPGRDNTGIEEQLSYWIAEQLDLPYNYRRFIHLHVNGVTELERGSVYEDVQQPGSEIIKEWASNDPDGDFYKIERWFEFSDAGRAMADPQPTLQEFTTTGGAKKLARYRWNWLKRATRDVNDYSNIFKLVDAVNAPSPEPYTAATEALVDVEQWMRIFAVEHIVANFDSYGHIIGKNMYAYKPEDGKWLLFMFDIDWVMRESAVHGVTTSAPLFDVYDPVIKRMYNHPPFRRAYFRAVYDAVHGPLRSEKIDPVIDARHEALVANGITRSAGRPLNSPESVKTWIASRRNYLVQQLAGVAAPWTVESPSEADSTTGASPLLLTGTAPVQVKAIQVNGAVYPLTWTTVTDWSLAYPLRPGINELRIQGFDRHDQPVAEAVANLTVNFTGADPTAGVMVLINEWLADNTRTLSDPADGQFDDWFELFNPGGEVVDLSGYTLTDDLMDPRKFVIPAPTTIPARGHLLVWADGEPEQTVENDALHASFRLDRDGEEIGLFTPSGRLVDSVVFGPQSADVSHGRLPEGADGPFVSMTKPTPGMANIRPEPIPVRILDAQLSGDGKLTLTWSSEPGRNYRVQFKNRLSDAAWTEATQVSAAGSVSSTSENVSPETTARFYRIVQAD